MKHLIHVYRACVHKRGERDVYVKINIVLLIANVLKRCDELKQKMITSYDFSVREGVILVKL